MTATLPRRSLRQSLVRPPLYVYGLMVVGGVYELASGGLEETCWSNFCVNLRSLISAAVASATIASSSLRARTR